MRRMTFWAMVGLLLAGPAMAADTALLVYGTTEAAAARPLVEDFQQLNPGVKVEYIQRNAIELHNKAVSEIAGKAGSADLLWSAGMDFQMQLVRSGWVMSYASPEAARLPSWAVWDDQAYATTFEPVGLLYNKRQLPEADMPKSHADLAQLLNAEPGRLKGKLVGYDPERSITGYLSFARDIAQGDVGWDLARGFRAAGIKLETRPEALRDRVASGEQPLGYDVGGADAFGWLRQNPSLGFLLPTDFTVVTSRIALIPKAARHPEAAKLFLDYLLSQRGQTLIAQAGLYAVHPDVPDAPSAEALRREFGDIFRPTPLTPDLADYAEPSKRPALIDRWGLLVLGRKPPLSPQEAAAAMKR